jgi:hypothetical protein
MIEQEIHSVLKTLALRRPVFHSEADFQHELALELSNLDYQLRLEVPKSVIINRTQVKVEIDIIATKNGLRTALELKYVKSATKIRFDDEIFDLKNTWGTNLSRFDCLSDARRIDSIILAGHANNGFAIFLTNTSEAWEYDTSTGSNLAKNFSIHEGRRLEQGLDYIWYPEKPSQGSVSSKRLPPYSPIRFQRDRIIAWHDYSDLDGASQTFKYCLL